MSTERIAALTAFENLDRVLQIEMRPTGLPAGIMGRLYDIARGDAEPLSYRAAEALLSPGTKRIACLTGIKWDTHLPVGEIDGPIGAAALARALTELDRTVHVVVPEAMLSVMHAVRTSVGSEFGVVAEGDAKAEDYDAAITIEKLGRNRKGVYHSILGAPLNDQSSFADDLIESLNARGKITIGIGDGGNEIGFGGVFDEARRIVPGGASCGCPCGDGLVTATATAILIPSSVSNFGAYAVTAAMGILVSRPLLLISPRSVADAMEAAAARGCIDGGSFEIGRVADDGIPIEAVQSIVTLLRTIATQRFRSTHRHA